MNLSDDTTASLWQRLKLEAERLVAREELLKPLVRAHVLDRTNFAEALASVLASRLCEHALPAVDLHRLFEPVLAMPEILQAAGKDLVAVVERDPAAQSLAIVPFLHFKGFQSLQAHRISHHIWTSGRPDLAFYLQGRIALAYGVDFHPAARIGSGIMIDHATGVVVGETAVIGDDVSMLHGVTLGGTGKQTGDRHPKVGNGVLLGSGAKILGNVRIGDGSKVGAGSVVLADVPPHCTVVGVPARVVGRPRCSEPGLDMDQEIEDDSQV
jgi:serine O-acetyltransferase